VGEAVVARGWTHHDDAVTARTRNALCLLAAVAAVGVVTGLFLSLYTSHRYALPVGYDTPKYVWRANLVTAEGTTALAGSAQAPLHVNADRPGFPALAAVLHAVSGIQPLDLTFVLPAVLAAVIGLATGAFAVRVLREPPWSFAVYAVGVGASVNVALIAIGYADTLLAVSVLLGAATAAVLAAGGERTVPAVVVLLAGATAIHWNFALLFLLVLGGLALVLVPESLRARRSGTASIATPSGRLGIAVGGSAVAALGTLATGPAWPLGVSLGRPEFLDKIRRDVPRYRFWALGPAAALGIPALRSKESQRRRGLWLLLIWALGGAAAVALVQAGAAIPAHRILAFSLAIPILATAAFVGFGRIAARRAATAGRVAGAVVILAGLAGSAFLGHRVWSSTVPWVDREQFAQSQLAGRYLETVHTDRPVIFVIDVPASTIGAVNLPFRIIRSALPGDVVRRTYVYLGDVDALLAGRPTLIPGDPTDFGELSQTFLDGVRPVLDEHPMVLVLRRFDRQFNRSAADAPDRVIDNDLLVVRGPLPDHSIAPPPPRRPHSNWWLAGTTALALAILLLAGSGWSMALLPGNTAISVALAPAFGIATLVLAGVIEGRLGFSLGGAAGICVMTVTTAAGWAARAASNRRAPGRHTTAAS
jgi:hypothetical protein